MDTIILKFLNEVNVKYVRLMLENMQKTGRKFEYEGALLAEQNIEYFIDNKTIRNIKESQTYRPSLASYFIVQLLLLGLHIFEERIFAQVFVVSRALEIHIFRHLGFRSIHRIAQKFTSFTTDKTSYRLNKQNGDFHSTCTINVPFSTNPLTRIC